MDDFKLPNKRVFYKALTHSLRILGTKPEKEEKGRPANVPYKLERPLMSEHFTYPDGTEYYFRNGETRYPDNGDEKEKRPETEDDKKGVDKQPTPPKNQS